MLWLCQKRVCCQPWAGILLLPGQAGQGAAVLLPEGCRSFPRDRGVHQGQSVTPRAGRGNPRSGVSRGRCATRYDSIPGQQRPRAGGRVPGQEHPRAAGASSGQERPPWWEHPRAGAILGQVRLGAGPSPGLGLGLRRAPPARRCRSVPYGRSHRAPPPLRPPRRIWRPPPRSRARGGMMDPRLRQLTPRARLPAVNGGGR